MFFVGPRLRLLLLASVCVLLLCGARADAMFPLTTPQNKAGCVIVRQAGATEAERHAAEELAATLEKITGARFEVRDSLPPGGQRAILVGPGSAAASAFPEVPLGAFGADEIVLRAKGPYLLIAGGRPRGTRYAVSRFLQRHCGVRWWAPWAADIPRRARLEIPADLNVREKPAFEYREPFWFPAFDGDWAARHFYNGQSARLARQHGGKITYKGFVHTFYPLVPPEKHFQPHPEWYSLLNGKRTVEGGQLCLTNPQLRDFVVARVREWLKESPEADIVSISQNDWHGACQCADCKAVDDREGSHAGTLLAFVNYVAEKIEPEFPHVAIDTLAYQYTRRPPKTIKPRPNVIVRLCSIECNFAEPLDHASNAAFARDIRDWARICDRLYVWDYTTDFAHYVQPHPNWFVLGPNVRFFRKHHVKGLFEQGAYQSHGSEMSEMRAWVLARLLWDPAQDDRKLISEFLNGYYGRAAARPIGQYLDLMREAAKGYYLSCYSPPDAPFLKFATLSRAERLWQQAEDAVKDDPDKRWRVRQGRLPVRYVWLVRWSPLRREALRGGEKWPLPASRKAVADEWLSVATGPGPAGWSRMTHLNEGGVTPESFAARFARDLPEPPGDPKRWANPPAPADITKAVGGVDVQDGEATLYREGELAEFRADAKASDGAAVWMPGSHHEWALQIPLARLPERARTGRWDVYVVARIDKKAGAGPDTKAFTAGVWDSQGSVSRGEIGVTVAAAATDRYRSHRIGTVEFKPGQYLWVAPAANAEVEAVWVDRIYLVPEKRSREAAATPQTPEPPGGDRP